MTFPAAQAPIDLWDFPVWLDPVTHLRYSPFRTLVGGRPAVVLFFVLSGFVLAIPFARHSQRPYSEYLLKRFLRIYLPFAASLCFATIVFMMSQQETVNGLSDWFNTKSWTDFPSPIVLLKHLAMTGLAADVQLNNVMWSLVHEVRISIVFPLIALFVLLKPRLAIACFFTIWVVANGVNELIKPGSIIGSFVDSCGYMLFFALGAWLLYNLEMVRDVLASWTSRRSSCALFVIICACALPPGVSGAELLYGFASIGLIGLSLSRPNWQAFLGSEPIEWLGRVSFSLYLFHLPFLLFVFRGWSDSVHPFWLISIVICGSLMLAQAGYWLVERPAMDLGKQLTAHNRRRSPAPTGSD